jgi:hypothetical protein
MGGSITGRKAIAIYQWWGKEEEVRSKKNDAKASTEKERSEMPHQKPKQHTRYSQQETLCQQTTRSTPPYKTTAITTCSVATTGRRASTPATSTSKQHQHPHSQPPKTVNMRIHRRTRMQTCISGSASTGDPWMFGEYWEPAGRSVIEGMSDRLVWQRKIMVREFEYIKGRFEVQIE